LLFPSASILQTPTTLRNDFGSAPTVSYENSSYSESAELAHTSSAAKPVQAIAVVMVLLAIFMVDLRH
jgi:hypothetical protein